MSQSAIQGAQPVCAQPCVAPPKPPLAPRFSAELMKMLAQLVMLR